MRIAAQFGETVPLTPRGPRMGVTEPLPHRILPVVGIWTRQHGADAYFRQVERGNIVFGGAAATAGAYRSTINPRDPHDDRAVGRDRSNNIDASLLHEAARLPFSSRHCLPSRHDRSIGHCFLPSLPYCFRKAVRSLISCSFLMPAKTILVPGILAFGSLMYSAKTASSQVMAAFLLAGE